MYFMRILCMSEMTLLYIRCDVLLCPFLSECEEVVETFQRVLWEILDTQQADGLWTGGAVQQGDTLQDEGCCQHCAQFLRSLHE